MEYLFATIIFIIILIGILYFIYLKIFKDKKTKDKKDIKMKNVKKIIFDLSEVIEDHKGASIKFGSEIAYSDVIQALENLKEDEKIEEIVLNVDKIVLSEIHIEELSSLFAKLRERKKIKAFATDLDIISYKISLFADEILMLNTRQANLSFRGYKFQDFYLVKLLSKLGIKMNVLHIGNYKVAGENFYLKHISEERKESLKTIGNESLNNFLSLVKNRRNIEIEELLDNGELLFLENEKSKDLGLIDGIYDSKEFEKKYNLEKDTIYFSEYINRYKKKKNKIKNTIAVIFLEGVIKSESKNSKPYISYDNVKEKIDLLNEIENLKGVVLRINSPGGSAIESEKIYQKLKSIKVPIYISMGTYCASGGYYIASVGKKIFSNIETLTGSIGVVLMYPEIKSLLEKTEINLETVSRGKGLDIFDFYFELKEESKEKIYNTMRSTYLEFKNHVMNLRKFSDEEVEKLAAGRVWLGSQAKENGLVDKIATLTETIQELANDLKLDEYKVEYIEAKKSLKEIKADLLPNFGIVSKLYLKNKFSSEIDELEFICANQKKILLYDNTIKKLI